ncbi:MAG: hypothetical protein ACRDGV_11020 [Candidatus Limnocylindria bacterium]
MAALIVTVVAAPPARASDDGTQVLPGHTVHAIAADVDGDGVREIVRVAVDPNRLARFVLEAWAHDGERWSLIASTDVIRRNEADNARVPINANADASGLVVWNDGTRERVLLVTVGNVAEAGRGCCLTISSVTMDGGQLRASPLLGTFGNAQSVVVLDIDGDGTDELLVIEPPVEPHQNYVRLLRWNGVSGFDAQRLALPPGARGGLGWVHGETDGIPGEEIVFGPAESHEFVRIGGDADGEVRIETASSQLPGPTEAFFHLFGAAGGSLMAIAPNEIRVMRWPRDGELTSVRSLTDSERGGLGVLGQGEGAVIVGHGRQAPGDPSPPEVVIYDQDLTVLDRISASPSTARLWELGARDLPALRSISHDIYPYLGPLPGGLADGRDAFVAPGGIIALDELGDLEVRPTTGLVGSWPVGLAGEDGAWMVVGDGYLGTRDTAWLFPSLWVGSLVVAPTATVLPAEHHDGRLAPQLRNAVAVPGEDGTERLATTDGGFEATVTGPPGSRVALVVDQSIMFDGELGSEPLVLDVAPRRSGDENQAFDAALVLVTPVGAAYSVSWQAEILREQPELSASAASDPFSLSATVRGEASLGTAVTVDGRSAPLGADGTFTLAVDAPLWPREVLIVARDPVGNETTERLSVVGVFDYRGLPGVPIVVVATLLIGVALFVRTPRRAPDARLAGDDGRLEELDEVDAR